jgi:hypothetical protein
LGNRRGIWITHYFLFRTAAFIVRIGTIVVFENVISSLAPSRFFDFMQSGFMCLASASASPSEWRRVRTLRGENYAIAAGHRICQRRLAQQRFKCRLLLLFAVCS